MEVQHHPDYYLHYSDCEISHYHGESWESVDVLGIAFDQSDDFVGGEHIKAASQKGTAEGAENEVDEDGDIEKVEHSEESGDCEAAVEERIDFEVVEQFGRLFGAIFVGDVVVEVAEDVGADHGADLEGDGDSGFVGAVVFGGEVGGHPHEKPVENGFEQGHF